MEGYIKLHRKLLENPIKGKPSWAWLWVVLLLKASHKETELIWDGGVIKLMPGQFITGRKQLSNETGIPETTIERALDYLEKNGHQIGQQKNNRFRIITIVNWEKYQAEDRKTDTKTDNRRTTDGQQTDTIKNDKNVKNEKNTIQPSAGNEINKLIDLFKSVNPTHERLFAQKPQREATERLLKKLGREKLEQIINSLPKSNSMDYAPRIFTPYELEKKLGALVAFVQKENKQTNLVIKI